MSRPRSTSMTPSRASDKPKVFEEGRTCEAAGCATKLSRYNAEVRCFLHAWPARSGR